MHKEAGMGVAQIGVPSCSQISRHAFMGSVATAIIGMAYALLIGCATTDPSPNTATKAQAPEPACDITYDPACTTMEKLREAMDPNPTSITVEKDVRQAPADSMKDIKIIEDRSSPKSPQKE